MANGQCQSTDTSRGKESDREAEDILTNLLSFELYTLNTWRAIWLLSAFDMRSSRLHYSGNNYFHCAGAFFTGHDWFRFQGFMSRAVAPYKEFQAARTQGVQTRSHQHQCLRVALATMFACRILHHAALRWQRLFCNLIFFGIASVAAPSGKSRMAMVEHSALHPSQGMPWEELIGATSVLALRKTL